jgi:hypothetical protein
MLGLFYYMNVWFKAAYKILMQTSVYLFNFVMRIRLPPSRVP